MLENEFHKLEEKKEIRTTISQIRKEIKKQDSKKAFLELLSGKRVHDRCIFYQRKMPRQGKIQHF